MTNLAFVLHKSKYPETWDFGKCVIACCVMAHFKNVQLYVLDASTKENRLIKKLSKEVFGDYYTFEMVQRIPLPRCRTVSPAIFYLENNLTPIKPNKDILKPNNEDPYVTTQFNAKYKESNITEGQIQPYLPNINRVDLSNIDYNKYSLPHLFNTVANAQQHIGTNSDIAVVAMCTNTRTTVLQSYAGRHFIHGCDYLLECLYRSDMTTMYDV